MLGPDLGGNPAKGKHRAVFVHPILAIYGYRKANRTPRELPDMNRIVGSTLGAGLLVAALTGCGGGPGTGDAGAEDFAVDVARQPAVAIAPFLSPDLTQMRAAFPGLAVMTSRPDERTVVYTIPATGSGGSHDRPSVLSLTFEPMAQGKVTRIHAAVTVSDTRIIDKGEKQIDEAKVDLALKNAITAIGAGLAEDRSAARGASQLALLLGSLAVATNSRTFAMAADMRAHPDRYAEQLAASALGDLLAHRMGEPDAVAEGIDGDRRRAVRIDDRAEGDEPDPASDFGQPDMPDPSHNEN